MSDYHSSRVPSSDPGEFDGADEFLHVRDVFRRLRRGLAQTTALGLLGIAIGGVGGWFFPQSGPPVTSTRILLSFPGIDKGVYPDDSRVSAKDLLAPDVLTAALRHIGLNDSGDLSATIRSSISIQDYVPAGRNHERTPFPDEFDVDFTPPATVNLSAPQRRALLMAIFDAYGERFRRSFAEAPVAFTNLNAQLARIDFDNYEEIFSKQLASIDDYLTRLAKEAPMFHSQATGLSFNDLKDESRIFSTVHLRPTLGMIRISGLSRDRRSALLRIDYRLKELGEDERQAAAEEHAVRELLEQAEAHGEKSFTRVSPNGNVMPIVDQGLLDSLIASDSYNFLIRKDLDANIKVKDIQASMENIRAQREMMERVAVHPDSDEASLLAQTRGEVQSLLDSHRQLLDDLNRTYAEYMDRKFGDVIHLSAPIMTENPLRRVKQGCTLGAFLGITLGLGLSLLEIYLGHRRA